MNKCEVCGKEYEENDLDLVEVDECESVWVCRNCEEVVKNAGR